MKYRVTLDTMASLSFLVEAGGVKEAVEIARNEDPHEAEEVVYSEPYQGYHVTEDETGEEYYGVGRDHPSWRSPK